MEFNVFPSQYKKMVEEEAVEETKKATLESSEVKSMIKKAERPAPDSSMYIMGCGFVGCIVGLFICIPIGFEDYSTFNDVFWPWFICILIGIFVGWIFYAAVKASYNSTNDYIARSVTNEDEHLKSTLESINEKAEAEYNEYVSGFESNAQKMSVKYVDSKVAAEVIDWIADGYIREIGATDRRGHIQMVYVPFVFYVYRDSITCNLGTYDFELKRCRPLSGPLHQTALARTIAAAVQLKVSMKYPRDISGTDNLINISYDYLENCVCCSISYNASNGNYIALREWE